jgi:SAM-dependent methyltransferase
MTSTTLGIGHRGGEHVPAPPRVMSDAERRWRVLIATFVVALFVNAALLFTVEPMFSKMVLPLLGGTPSVWNTCMMFYQAVLLVGYLYAHLLSRHAAVRRQWIIHAALLIVSLVAVPITVARGWAPPPGAPPVPWLVALLAVSLGFPFLLLSAGAPLLQQWFASTDHPSARDPYPLYAASNLGSLLALLAYPSLLEPYLTLTNQNRLWAVAYWLVVVLIALCGWLATRMPAGAAVVEQEAVPARASSRFLRLWTTSDADPALLSTTVTMRRRIRWVLLSFAPSSLLLGVTTHLTTDIAPVPLLWVVPLALYLLSFVIVFARRSILPRDLVFGMQTLLVPAVAVVLAIGVQRHVTALAPLHLLAFFTTAVVLHGELVRTRPAPARLTEFYLWIAFGGLLGGVFNALIAPALFDTLLEYPAALIIAAMLRPALGTDAERRFTRVLDFTLPILLYLLILGVARTPLSSKLGSQAPLIITSAYAVICVAFLHRPFRFALGLAALIIATDVARGRDIQTMTTARSFFGMYRVRRWDSFHVLQHGTTTHGAQSTLPALRREPLTYYHRTGPLGQIFAGLMVDKPRRNVAIVGLGTGTVVCYSRPGERWTFYEIDPLIVRLARDARYFTYVRDCQPDVHIVLGDARLSLARAADSTYDLIVLDAFSSDAIPAHLLTREALAVYLEKLAPGGVVAFHISNRYIDLKPVLAELARDARVPGAVGNIDAVTPAEDAQYKTTSTWVAIAHHATDLAPLTRLPNWEVLPPRADVGVWTDDYSNILGVFRWK